MIKPFYYLFYVIYKLLMLKFKEDKPEEDMLGRVLGFIMLMMLFPIGVATVKIKKHLMIDISLTIPFMFFLYLIGKVILKDKYKKIITNVEEMSKKNHITSASILLSWFILIPIILIILL